MSTTSPDTGTTTRVGAATPGVSRQWRGVIEEYRDRLDIPEGTKGRLAGAVPLLLDGVFQHLTGVDATTVLDRLAGQAGAVQVVVVDDHPAVAAWTHAVGLRRAACIEPASRPPAKAPT